MFISLFIFVYDFCYRVNQLIIAALDSLNSTAGAGTFAIYEEPVEASGGRNRAVLAVMYECYVKARQQA